jgi:hypothetical protein
LGKSVLLAYQINVFNSLIGKWEFGNIGGSVYLCVDRWKPDSFIPKTLRKLFEFWFNFVEQLSGELAKPQVSSEVVSFNYWAICKTSLAYVFTTFYKKVAFWKQLHHNNCWFSLLRCYNGKSSYGLIFWGISYVWVGFGINLFFYFLFFLTLGHWGVKMSNKSICEMTKSLEKMHKNLHLGFSLIPLPPPLCVFTLHSHLDKHYGNIYKLINCLVGAKHGEHILTLFYLTPISTSSNHIGVCLVSTNKLV